MSRRVDPLGCQCLVSGHGVVLDLVQRLLVHLGGEIVHALNHPVDMPRSRDPSASAAEVNAAESHFKRALMTREFGLNRN